MKTISLVVACYNEEQNISVMYERVNALFERLPTYTYELIFVDNMSTDSSRRLLQDLISVDDRVKSIFMARNFGQSQPSYLAGLRAAQGDAVVLLDGDLQDPPEVIEQFVQQWEQGAQVVYGVRQKRRGNIVLRFFYFCFYRIFRTLSYLDIPLDAGDFGLMDRRVVDVIAQLPEKDVYIRGMRTWAGFRQVGVGYIRQERYAGFSTNKFLTNIYWFKKAIVNFSYKPLEYISFLAMASMAATGICAGTYLYLYITNGAPRGFLTLLMSILCIGSIQLLSLSVIAEYLIRIFEEVKNRPSYVIDRIVTHQDLVKGSSIMPSQLEQHRLKTKHTKVQL